MNNSIENVLKFIQSDDLVLDVGGGVNPFQRADAVIDMVPYDSFLVEQQKRKPGLSTPEYRVSQNTWYTGDICAPQVWANIPDKAYDFVLCTHTLEDLRDPLFVCGQLQRVGKAGYIEVPSRFRECLKVNADEVVTGWEHHRWIVEVENGTIFFKDKIPWIHHFDYLGEARRDQAFDYFKQFTAIHWIGSFDYAERVHKGRETETEDLFYYYDHYDYSQALSIEKPPLLFTIDNIPFRGKTLYQTHEYTLAIEQKYDLQAIHTLHVQRLEREKARSFHKVTSLARRVLARLGWRQHSQRL